MAQRMAKLAQGGDEPITLGVAAQLLKVTKTTVWRWATNGLNGVMLATVKVGRAQYTSRDAIEAFQRRSPRVPDMAAARAELAAKVREMSHA